MPALENYVVEISVSKGISLGKMTTKKKTWKTFCAMFDRSKILVDTSCSFAQYQAMSRDEQGKKKMQAGNWMPALFEGGIRKGPNQLCRTMVVFDLDYVTIEQLANIRLGAVPIADFAWKMHTTRSHCPEAPRVRMAVPCDREMTLEEANAVTRYLATTLANDPEEGIEIPDTVSMKSNQVMYQPSISRDQDYWTDVNIGDVVCVDDFLADHPHWTDHALLPGRESEKNRGVSDPNNKMAWPTEKDGIIGAWCRTYTVDDAIAEFLTDVYVLGDSSTETRYTYLLGSGTNSNGAVSYDEGMFLFSNHGTDPIEGAANAWDLVRIHKFGHLDADSPANTSPGNMPSFKAMRKFASEDAGTSQEMLSKILPDDWTEYEDDEDVEEARSAPKKAKPDTTFDDILGTDPDDTDSEIDDILGDAPEDEAEDTPKWGTALMLDKQDKLEKSLHNCATLVKNSDRIAPCIALNDLDGSPYLRRKLRFPKANIVQAVVDDMMIGRRWSDNDTAALMCGLAAPIKMGGFETQFPRQDVELALLQAAEQNRFNPFLDKVRSVKWDGVPRLKTFFHDWFRTIDNEYHSELAIIWFIAGIARQYEPGHRFDLVPILGGAQGGGKTGAIAALGMGHGGSLSGDYHDTQKMTESTIGKTVLEVAELKGMSKGMIEDLKHYFTAVMDTIRLAYRRNSEDFYRRCVYMGTTNQSHYLRDEENRRFCPVLTNTSDANKIDFVNFLPLIPQFWAEAHHLYLEMRKAQPKEMLPLHFTSKAAKAEALRLQTESRETLPHEPVVEVIESWLNTPVPETFDGDDDFDSDEPRVRNLVSATTIRVEMWDNAIIRDLRVGADKIIAQALGKLEGWEAIGQCRRFGEKRRWYARTGTDNKRKHVPASAVGVQAEEPSADDLLD